MGRARWLVPVVVFCFLLPRGSFGQQPIHWETSIESAKAAASHSNRLVLVFFCAGYCAPCHRMENELRNQTGAVTTLETNYVPVKINTEYYPNTAKQFGVACVPTTVVIAPNAQGTILASFAEYMPVDQYLSKLSKVALETKQRNAGGLVQIQASPAVGNAASGPPPAAGPTSPVPSASPFSNPGANRGGSNINTPAATAIANGPAVGPPRDLQRPADNLKQRPNPPIGLEGFCPVQLVEHSRWEPGNRAWGAIHRGRIYLFSGLDERTRFLANPDRYSPVSSGDDVVVLLDQGRPVPGNRVHGLQFEGHVYLFASEATLEKFHSNPRYYADRALELVRSTAQVSAAH
jgi:YHS domain-containing protein/thioredoxin-related protein